MVSFAEGQMGANDAATTSPISPLYLSLPPSSIIGSIEGVVSALFEENDDTRNIIIDMRECLFIEVSSLIYLVSFITAREREGLRTTIALPKSKKVRDFLRVWKFPEAIRGASGKLFYNMVLEEDRHYFGENANYEDLKYAGTTLMSGLDRLVSERFFSITHCPIHQNKSSIAAVKNESSRWEQRLIMSVLENHLSGPKGYISSRVIYESMTNAVRHPNASFIQTASHLGATGASSGQGGGFLTIVFWDDGDSIVDTLRKVLSEGREIRSGNIPLVQNKFWVKLSDGGREEARIVTSDFLPDKDTSDDIILLSSIFPGITRDPSGREHVVHEDLASEMELNRPGMGLFILVNSVVDVFGGSVSFRSHYHFLNIKKPKDLTAKKEGASYQVKIVKAVPSLPKFLGNMITVRIPLEAKI